MDESADPFAHRQIPNETPTHGRRFLSARAVIRAPHHPMQASEVVSQAHQGPFARDFLFAAQTEPTKAHRFFDDPKDRLDGVVIALLDDMGLSGGGGTRETDNRND